MKRRSDVSVMWKEAGILFAITLTAGILLGFVYELTKEPIRIQQEKAVQEACAAVFPDEKDAEFREISLAAGGIEGAQLPQGVEIGSVYEALNKSGQFLGYVVESVSTQGYGGNIVLYVGVAEDGTVGGVSILDISETAGLGMEAPKVLAPQFAGKRVEQFSYTKTGSRTDSEVDAISAATVTTRAVVNAVNGALETARILLQGGGMHE